MATIQDLVNNGTNTIFIDWEGFLSKALRNKN